MRAQYFLLFTAIIIFLIFSYYLPKINEQTITEYEMLILHNFRTEINYIMLNNWTGNLSDYVSKFKNYLENLGYHNYTITQKLPGYVLEYYSSDSEYKNKTILKKLHLCGDDINTNLPPIKIWYCFCLKLITRDGNYSDFFCI